MRSETIYRYYTNWFNRYGSLETHEIIVLSSFDDPTVWPFRVESYSDIEDSFEDNKERICNYSKNISKEVFDKIKEYIAQNDELRDCEENIHNDGVMDGSGESYYFNCDKYQKRVSGTSIYSCGSYEDEHLPSHKRTANHTVFCAVREINRILAEAGVEV